MTREERRVLLSVLYAASVVFAFLGGFLFSEMEWFQPAKQALLSFLHLMPVSSLSPPA